MLLITEQLDLHGLTLLAQGRILALQVRRFIQPTHAQALAGQILGGGYQHYLNAPSIGRIGMAFYETEGQPQRMTEYFQQAGDHISELRRRCLPFASPIDVLRCALDERWPAGAHLQTLFGCKMFVGLSRVVEPSVQFLAHHDIFAKDAPETLAALSLHQQFAANIYLAMPEQGGELQLWQQEMAAELFDQMRGESYGIDPALLGEPTVELQPAAGDLVLFNSRKMHAVASSQQRSRLSLSCFVGYRDYHQPLTFWS